MFYIGGDVQSFEFNFGLKIAGSTTECPMKIYYSNATALKTPSDITGDILTGFAEIGTQANMDLLKTQDGFYLGNTTSTVNSIDQMMVELDLTPLCNSLFSGSNNSLKSSLKTITIDAWIHGSGSNNNVLTNGVQGKMWNGTAWDNAASLGNSASVITKGTVSGGNGFNIYINPNNKLYILIHATYPSNGTIISSVSIEYLNIKLDIARTPDTIQSILANLPLYWAMVVKGFSPNWDSTLTKDKLIFNIGTDGNNRAGLYYYGTSSKKFVFYKIENGIFTTLQSPLPTFEKYKVYNFIVSNTPTGMNLQLLKNDFVLESVSNLTPSTLSGIKTLKILSDYNDINLSDAFAESFHLLDLQRIGKPNGFTDAEAGAILHGTLPNILSLTNPELFNIDKVILFNNPTNDQTNTNGKARRIGNTIILNANATNQNSGLDIPVLPNNRYELNGSILGNAYVHLYYKYNNIELSRVYNTLTESQSSYSFITPPNCNKITLPLSNGINTGIFTFLNISLRRKD